ncbi:MAG: hypothetical protein LC808_01280, partial [Actinobacteria bacterium]|nr:hypothetical protein [Actinomycetota bacterium]
MSDGTARRREKASDIEELPRPPRAPDPHKGERQPPKPPPPPKQEASTEAPERPSRSRKVSPPREQAPPKEGTPTDPEATENGNAGGSRGRNRKRGPRRRPPRGPRVRADRVMLVREDERGAQMAVLENGSIVEHYVTHQGDRSFVGNVYLGKVQNVLPGMEASFVDIGEARNGVLYAGEVGIAGDEGDE